MDVRENHSNDVSEPHDARCTLHETYGDGGGGGSSRTLVPVATTAASAPRYVTEKLQWPQATNMA